MGMNVGLGNPLDNVEIQVGDTPTAAGTGDTITGDSIDMKDHQALIVLVHFGTITATAVTTVKIQESDDDSTYSDVTGATDSVAADDDNQICAIGIQRPLLSKRYARVAIVRATANSVINGAQYIAFGKDQPITQGSTVVA